MIEKPHTIKGEVTIQVKTRMYYEPTVEDMKNALAEQAPGSVLNCTNVEIDNVRIEGEDVTEEFNL